MPDYTNSDKSKGEPEKKIERLVLTGEVTQKPKGIGHKFRTIFLGGDARTAGSYVLADIILPSVRDLLFDVLRGGAEKVIYGESRRSRNRPIETRARTTYNAFSQMRDPREVVHLPGQPPRATSYRSQRAGEKDLVMSNKEDAEALVEKLIDIIDTYDAASVMDLNEILGFASSPIDNKWGWNTLGKVDIRQVRDGWLIELPPVEEI